MGEAAGYEHPVLMERLGTLRDATCRAPGCSRRAERCDCDHVVPYPAGPTNVDNTCCLCRRHHRLTTHAPGWGLELTESGTAVWTTPTGRALATDPADHAGDSQPESAPDPGDGAQPDGDSEPDEPPF